jgi:hypothetical protein
MAEGGGFAMKAAIYPRLVLVTLCCLLALTTSAFADCGWVVWVEHKLSGALADNGFAATKWELRSAWDTKQQCDSMAASSADLAFNQGQPTPTSPGIDRTIWVAPHYSLRTFYKSKSSLGIQTEDWQSFQCFPGTIDPAKAGSYR